MNQYVNQIINSKKIERTIIYLCMKQQRLDLVKDLFQFCLVEFLEKDISKLILTTNIETYFISIVINQINSNTSEFYKEYRNSGFNRNNKTSNIIIDPIYEDTLDDIIRDNIREETLLKEINRAILACDPFKIDLFKMKYFDNKTYKEISQFYNISEKRVVNKISSVKKDIINILNQVDTQSEIKIKMWRLRRKQQGKIEITEDIKKEIVNRYKFGERTRILSKEYQLSLPTILKIIKHK